jgi:hypothetical protein
MSAEIFLSAYVPNPPIVAATATNTPAKAKKIMVVKRREFSPKMSVRNVKNGYSDRKPTTV